MIGDQHAERVVQGIQRQEAPVVRLVDELMSRYPCGGQPLARQVAAQELL